METQNGLSNGGGGQWPPAESGDGTLAQNDSVSGALGSAQNQTPEISNPESGIPTVSVPKGGGAIRGIGEKFQVSGPTGTGNVSIPIFASSGRSGFGPQLKFSYDSGMGNGPFGLGWNLSIPSITRKTDKGLPRYNDATDSDVFINSGLEDLVPHKALDSDGYWTKSKPVQRTVRGTKFSIKSFRPRIESSFSRIESWTDTSTSDCHWRVITKENVTSLYGTSLESRIFDPNNSTRVFSWLLSQVFDDKGNVTEYDYKAENSQGVDVTNAHELNRDEKYRTVARYPKRIKYGNRISKGLCSASGSLDWMFELVFDYGEHHVECPTPAETMPWPVRRDPFSVYRSCFEVRKYRLCRRILMFHHFPEEANIGRDYLVGSTDLAYKQDTTSPFENASVLSLVSSITHKRYVRREAHYICDSFAPVEFDYSKAEVSTEVQDLDPVSLEGIPFGVDDQLYHWVDLDAEGVPGILTKQGGQYYYKANLGNGKFAATQSLPTSPPVSIQEQFIDLTGDGRLDFVQLDGPSPGFYKRDWALEKEWEPFRTFPLLPQINWKDPNIRMIDLTGDGLTDVLIVNDEVFTWFPGVGEDGFLEPQYWRPPVDEDKGPRLLLETYNESIFLADMCGDGLIDLLRIRNGESCYWPSLGYGRFGAKVSMDNSPFFEYSDEFQQRRIRLADVDGSGLSDMIYLHEKGPVLYLNQAGNSWSSGSRLGPFPTVDDMNTVSVVDLLGHGTGCLVWSSGHLSDSRRQMRYLDLMKQGKPYLLTCMKNNLGSETYITYKSSTSFYLKDKAAGKPWLTRLPFPVQVVEKATTIDRISGNELMTRYAYHDGFFDPFEREFRGFGMVESIDCEEFQSMLPGIDDVATNYDPAFRSPPVLTKSWYETGAYLRGRHIAEQYEDEFYRESPPAIGSLLPLSSLPQKIRFGNEEIPFDFNTQEYREIYRSLKGMVLREEVYGLDGTTFQDHPYTVKQMNYTVECFQPVGDLEPLETNRHAVFFTHPRESVEFTYERLSTFKPGKLQVDPRVSHSLVMSVDTFGNVLRTVAINYGRCHKEEDSLLNDVDHRRQQQTQMILGINQYTNLVKTEDSWRVPLLWNTTSSELVNFPSKITKRAQWLYTFSEISDLVRCVENGAHDIPFEVNASVVADKSHVHRRLLQDIRTQFHSNDLSQALPFGEVQSLALPFQKYQQVLTEGQLQEIFVKDGKIPSRDALTYIMRARGGYVQLEGSSAWWAPSGRIFYSPDQSHSSLQESEYAARHFFMPHRFRDPFYNSSFRSESRITYDQYDLLVLEHEDSVGNRMTAGIRNEDSRKPLVLKSIDYRVLEPTIIMDPNRNVNAYAYDVRARLTAKAIMGKPGQREGDELSGFKQFLTEQAISSYLSDPIGREAALLGDATTRFIYDDLAYFRTRSSEKPHPPTTAAIVRETHVSQITPGGHSRLELSFVYADASGRAIQTKALAEPDPQTGAQRWITSGWEVFNNKGSVVKKHEPLYAHTHNYQPKAINGASTITLYDPLQRPVVNLFADHTWGKVVKTPWSEQVWDRADTILLNPNEDIDVQGYFKNLPTADYSPSWYRIRMDGTLGRRAQEAAEKASVYAGTPITHYFDGFGRDIINTSYDRVKRELGELVKESFFVSRTVFDITGNILEVLDPLGRKAEINKYDMVHNMLHKSSMEGGQTWSLLDCVKKPIYAWNSRGYETSVIYDTDQRQVKEFLNADGVQYLVSETMYGESEVDAEKNNIRARAVLFRDQSGIKQTKSFDFKGNLLSEGRTLAAQVDQIIDWSTPDDIPVESEIFLTMWKYDALNRVIEKVLPDKESVVRHTYNRLGQMQQVEMKLHGRSEWTYVLKDAQYNARGQRVLYSLGNGIESIFEYDPLVFRLTRILSKSRHRDSSPEERPGTPRTRKLQDLIYTYDSVGNISYIQDDSQESIFFQNHKVDPSNDYTYDALYRLVSASGREHLGQIKTEHGHAAPSHHAEDDTAMARYRENYFYDGAGNMLKICHMGKQNWTKNFNYHERSQLEPDRYSNRLSSTSIGDRIQDFRYEGNDGLMGNITSMPNLSLMKWDFKDQLQATAKQRSGGTPETTWYQYANGSKRIRKLTRRHGKEGQSTTRSSERIYIGSYEVYRKYGRDGSSIDLERETIVISIGDEKLAVHETLTKGSSTSPAELTRYQFDNQLGSSVLELDGSAKVITYEEYFAYGGTSYSAAVSQVDAPKRYR
ncbi:virulence plasmid 65kDa B protein-domain-containing protein, partial [Bisporella sp. PMI_857]